jgi:hypothetical protein
VAVGAVVGFAATFWTDWSKLPTLSELRTRLADGISGDDTPIILRNVGFFSEKLAPSGNAHEVVVEAIASKKFLKHCTADLRLEPTLKGSPLDGTPDPDNDKQNNGYEKFAFQIPGKDLPNSGKLRLRCDNYTSDFFAVENWPAKTADYGVVIGEEDNHTAAGEIHLACGTTPESWAKSTNHDVCKYVSVTSMGSASGNACGYSHFAIHCSTQP